MLLRSRRCRRRWHGASDDGDGAGGREASSWMWGGRWRQGPRRRCCGRSRPPSPGSLLPGSGPRSWERVLPVGSHPALSPGAPGGWEQPLPRTGASAPTTWGQPLAQSWSTQTCPHHSGGSRCPAIQEQGFLPLGGLPRPAPLVTTQWRHNSHGKSPEGVPRMKSTQCAAFCFNRFGANPGPLIALTPDCPHMPYFLKGVPITLRIGPPY